MKEDKESFKFSKMLEFSVLPLLNPESAAYHPGFHPTHQACSRRRQDAVGPVPKFSFIVFNCVLNDVHFMPTSPECRKEAYQNSSITFISLSISDIIAANSSVSLFMTMFLSIPARDEKVRRFKLTNQLFVCKIHPRLGLFQCIRHVVIVHHKVLEPRSHRSDKIFLRRNNILHAFQSAGRPCFWNG
jgi:hypothetical protein